VSPGGRDLRTARIAGVAGKSALREKAVFSAIFRTAAHFRQAVEIARLAGR
jgi:hypothetical protein